MIHEIAHKLQNRGFKEIKQINDSEGTIAYWIRKGDEDFVLVTKEYSYQGLASFMESLVKKASSAGITLLFYEDKNETLTVFDSAYYEEEADLSHGKSKKSDSRWLELTLNDGVSLEEYLSKKVTPTTMAGNNETLGSYT